MKKNTKLSKTEVLTSIGQTLTFLAVQKDAIDRLISEVTMDLCEEDLKRIVEMDIFGSCYKVLDAIEGMMQTRTVFLEAIAESDLVLDTARREEARETLEYLAIRKVRLERLHRLFSDYNQKLMNSRKSISD